MNTINKKNITVALYQIENPDNYGAIIRTCTCFDVDIMVIRPCGFILNRNIYKHASLDYLPKKITIYDSFTQFQRENQNRRIILFTPHSNIKFNKNLLKENDILLFGRESVGVPESIAAQSNLLTSIKMSPRARSLNLAMSVSIAVNTSIN